MDDGISYPSKWKTSERSFSLLDKTTPELVDEIGNIDECKHICLHMLQNYGRFISVTIREPLMKYTPDQHRRALTKFIKENNNIDEMILVEDYSPVENRLHYHGIVRNLTRRGEATMKAELKRFVGFNKVEIPKDNENIIKYIFKIYTEPDETQIQKIQPFYKSSYMYVNKH